MITTQNREKRMQWARQNLHNRFENIVWTDESMIQLENHRTFSYRKVGEAPRPKAQPKHPLKIMVWTGISKKGATNICLLNCSVNSSVYQEVLRTHLLLFSMNIYQMVNCSRITLRATRSKRHRNFLQITKFPCSRPHQKAPTAILSKTCGMN